MTPIEIRDECRKLNEVGTRAHVYLNVSEDNDDDQLVYAAVYPTGLGHSPPFSIYAKEWDEVFSLLRAKWETKSDKYRLDTIRKMALAIIRLTAENGECTDAALRTDGFSQEELARYGADAVVDADDIAGNGPFSIQSITAGVNAA